MKASFGADLSPCPEGWGIEELLLEAFREGICYGLPENTKSSPPEELTDNERLELMLTMREVNSQFDKRKQRIRDYGQVGLGIVGDLLEYSGKVALMRRGLELGLAIEGPEFQLAISGPHEILGSKLLSAFDRLDIPAFKDVLAVMQALQAQKNIREVKSKLKSKSGGRPLKAYNLDVAFPMALRTVVSRRSKYLTINEPGLGFTLRRIEWEELRDAVCKAQISFGGVADGIRFDDLSARIKSSQFSAFMISTPTDRKTWKQAG